MCAVAGSDSEQMGERLMIRRGAGQLQVPTAFGVEAHVVAGGDAERHRAVGPPKAGGAVAVALMAVTLAAAVVQRRRLAREQAWVAAVHVIWGAVERACTLLNPLTSRAGETAPSLL